jgi:hypothetical protein
MNKLDVLWGLNKFTTFGVFHDNYGKKYNTLQDSPLIRRSAKNQSLTYPLHDMDDAENEKIGGGETIIQTSR